MTAYKKDILTSCIQQYDETINIAISFFKKERQEKISKKI